VISASGDTLDLFAANWGMARAHPVAGISASVWGRHMQALRRTARDRRFRGLLHAHISRPWYSYHNERAHAMK
jgi:hypothetical protein